MKIFRPSFDEKSKHLFKFDSSPNNYSKIYVDGRFFFVTQVAINSPEQCAKIQRLVRLLLNAHQRGNPGQKLNVNQIERINRKGIHYKNQKNEPPLSLSKLGFDQKVIDEDLKANNGPDWEKEILDYAKILKKNKENEVISSPPNFLKKEWLTRPFLKLDNCPVSTATNLLMCHTKQKIGEIVTQKKFEKLFKKKDSTPEKLLNRSKVLSKHLKGSDIWKKIIEISTETSSDSIQTKERPFFGKNFFKFFFPRPPRFEGSIQSAPPNSNEKREPSSFSNAPSGTNNRNQPPHLIPPILLTPPPTQIKKNRSNSHGSHQSHESYQSSSSGYGSRPPTPRIQENYLTSLENQPLNSFEVTQSLGLKNKGENCFINAILQVIFSISVLKRTIVDAKGQHEAVKKAYERYQKALENPFPPPDIASSLREIDPNFKEGQHDPTEFLIKVLLPESLENREALPFFFEVQKKGHVQNRETIELHQEIQQSLLLCFPSQKERLTMEDLIKMNYSETQMVNPPPYLFIETKRIFEKNTHSTPIFLQQTFTLPKECDLNGKGATYKWVAFITHRGISQDNGHYTASIETSEQGYFHYDDSLAAQACKNTFLKYGQTFYLAFARRID